MVEDVTDEVLQTKALRKERDWDGLTYVKNRMAFGETMERMGAHREEYQSVALIMCDLNDLKGVNDAFGHDKGMSISAQPQNASGRHFPMGMYSVLAGMNLPLC